MRTVSLMLIGALLTLLIIKANALQSGHPNWLPFLMFMLTDLHKLTHDSPENLIVAMPSISSTAEMHQRALNSQSLILANASVETQNQLLRSPHLICFHVLQTSPLLGAGINNPFGS